MPNRYVNYFIGNIKTRPYVLLGFAGFLMGIRSFIPSRASSLDINMHDMYFVVANVSLYRFFAIILLFLWSVYMAANRLILSRRLTLFHVLFTLTPLIFFLIMQNHTWGMDGVSRRYYAVDAFEAQKPLLNFAGVFITVMLSLFIGQVIFIVNLAWGVIKSFRQRQVVKKL